NSHGFYNAYLSSEVHRYKLKDASYISSNIQNFGKNYKVNNLFRSNYVIINTEDEVQDPYIIDNSRQLPLETPPLLSTPIELIKLLVEQKSKQPLKLSDIFSGKASSSSLFLKQLTVLRPVNV